MIRAETAGGSNPYFATGAGGSLQMSCASFLGSGHRIEFYGRCSGCQRRAGGLAALAGAGATRQHRHLQVARDVQRGGHVLIERLAGGARLLGAVQHRDLLHGGGNRGHEVGDGEGAEHAHQEGADLLAVGIQVAGFLQQKAESTAYQPT